MSDAGAADSAQARLDMQADLLKKSYWWEKERGCVAAKTIASDGFPGVYANWILGAALANEAKQLSVVVPSREAFISIRRDDFLGVSPQTSYWNGVGVLPPKCTPERAKAGFDFAFTEKGESADCLIRYQDGIIRLQDEKDCFRAPEEFFESLGGSPPTLAEIAAKEKEFTNIGGGKWLRRVLKVDLMVDPRPIPKAERVPYEVEDITPERAELTILESCFWEGEENPSFFLKTLRDILPTKNQRETCAALIRDAGNFRNKGAILRMAELL